jgi:hypothetical protein
LPRARALLSWLRCHGPASQRPNEPPLSIYHLLSGTKVALPYLPNLLSHTHSPHPPHAESHAMPHELGVQLLTTLPLAYICVCTYFALFRVNAFDYNKLLPR